MEGNKEPLFDITLDSISDGDIDLTEANVEEGAGSEEDGAAEAGEEGGASDEDTKNKASKKEEKKEDKYLLDTTSINPEDEKEVSAEDTTGASKKDKKKVPGSEGDSSPVTPFASLLHEKGLLPNMDLEEFKKSEDKIQALLDATRKEIETENAKFINAFPPEMLEMAKAVANGVPFEALKEAKIRELEYEKINEDQLEDEDIQKRLVHDYLNAKGFSEKKIESLIETYESSDKLKPEAVEALEELKVMVKNYQTKIQEQHQEQQEDFNKQHKKQIENIKRTIDSTEEIIPGKSLGKVAKEKLYSNMTQIAGKDKNGNPVPFVMMLREKDPLKFDMAVTYLAEITNGFTDYSALGKSAKSLAVKELEKVLESNTSHKSGTSVASQSESEDELVKSLERMFNPSQ